MKNCPHPKLWKSQATPLPSLRDYYVKAISGQHSELRTKAPVPKRIYSTDALNIFSEQGLVYHPAALYSAAIAERNLDEGRKTERVLWTLERQERHFLFGDNAGFSIGNGAFYIDWNKPGDVERKRLALLRWLERVPNVVPYLDIPPWSIENSTVFTAFEDCVEATNESIEHWRDEMRKELPWLVVAHGRDLQETIDWWHKFKDYPALGIAFGSVLGENLFILVHLLRIIESEGYLNKLWLLHFFGHFTTKFFVIVSVLQKVLQLRYPNIRITFDATTPFRKAELSQIAWLTEQTGLVGRNCTTHGIPTAAAIDDRSIPFASRSSVFESLDGGDLINDKLSSILYGIHNLEQMLAAFKLWSKDIELACRDRRDVNGLHEEIDKIYFLYETLKEAIWGGGEGGLLKHEAYLTDVL